MIHRRTWFVVGLLVLGLLGGCAQPDATSARTVTVTVTAPTTVTEVKTVAEVQTQIVAPPAEVKTVSATVTVTKTPAAAAASGGNGSVLTFDGAKVAANIRKLLTDAPPAGYGITGVTDTSCPNDQPVTAGSVFLCHATIDNSSKSVKVTVLDGTGKYQVGLPA